jgi:hypothetical protein
MPIVRSTAFGVCVAVAVAAVGIGPAPGAALAQEAAASVQEAAASVQEAAASVPGVAASAVGAASDAYSQKDMDFVSVTAGERYAANGLERALLGAHYRDLWTTPMQVPVLDLESYAGGLTPEELGGGEQTASLHFQSGDGREFTFRSLDKNPTPALPEPFRGTVVNRLVQDGISSMNPAGALVAAELLAAAGVLHAEPRLAVMPDHERLGKYRKEFAGMLGFIELRPGDGFAGAGEVLDSDELFERLRESPDHRVAAASFLAARLVDQLMGDWDRHKDQWRWAAYPSAGRTMWRPIPRDRDQAFARFDGVITTLARKANPKLVTFGPEYPGNLVGFTWNGRDLDRILLTSLDAADFDSVAAAIQTALSDSVTTRALDRMPAGYRQLWGKRLVDALRRRRDALPEHARRYYRLLAGEVDVWATDAAEVAEVRREPGGAMVVRLRAEDAKTPYFERRFLAGETDEVRLYLRGGEDRVRIEGTWDGDGPALLVVREPGTDSLVGSGQAGPLAVYDHVEEPRRDEESEEEQDEESKPDPPRDWGGGLSAGPRAGYDADLGLLLGGQAIRTDYAFRRAPYGSRVGLAIVYATGADGLRADLTADLRRLNPRTRLDLLARASEIEVVRFNGLGNETADRGEAAEVDEWQFTLAPAVEYAAPDRLLVRGGPMLRHTTDGAGRLGLAGAVAVGGEAPDSAVRYGRVSAGGGFFPVTWSGAGTLGELHAHATGFLPLPLPGSPMLALRLGGKRLWGSFPFDEAAFLGGHGTVRGFEYQRFAGDAMVHGSVEVRVPVARILPRFVPTEIGVFGLGDAGRVWADGTESRKVHAAAGAGLWLAFFEPRNRLSLAWASGREGDRWYLRWGLGF